MRSTSVFSCSMYLRARAWEVAALDAPRRRRAAWGMRRVPCAAAACALPNQRPRLAAAPQPVPLPAPTHLGISTSVCAMSERICITRCAKLAGSMVWSTPVLGSRTTTDGALNRPSRNCGGRGGGRQAGSEVRLRSNSSWGRRHAGRRHADQGAGERLPASPAHLVPV